MSGTDFDIELKGAEVANEVPDHHKPGAGWAIFIVVAAFLIISQLIPYLERGTDSRANAKSVMQTLRATYLYGEGLRRLGGSDTALKQILEDAEAKVETSKKVDSEDALLWVVLQDAKGGKVETSDIVPVLQANNPERRAFAGIYGVEKLTRDRADQLVSQLPEGFLSRLAKVAAYRKAGVKNPSELVFSNREVFAPVALALFLVGAGLVGFGLLLVYVASRASGRLQPEGFPLREVTPAHADRLAGKVGLILFVSLSLPGFLLSPLRKTWHPAMLTAAASLCLLVIALLLARAPLFQRRLTWRELGWRRDRIGKDALWGLGAALANAPLLALVTAISSLFFRSLPPAEHPVTSDPTRLVDPLMLVATFFAASVVAPIVEETLFRGMLAPAMGSVFKPQFVGWIVAGFCFAAVHPTGIPAWPALATLGVVAAATNYQTGSLVSSVFMHAFHNAVILVVAVVILG